MYLIYGRWGPFCSRLKTPVLEAIIHYMSMQRKAAPTSQPRPLMKKKSLIVEHERFIQLRHLSFEDEYTVLGKLGSGSFGSVYKVEHKSLKLKRALKVIRNSSIGPYPTKEEIDVLIKLDHPNILKLYEFYEVKDKFFLITELFEGRELFTEIVEENPFTQKKASEIIAEILKGIHYTHTKGITHRDLKAENILIKKDEGKWIVKIIDWGLGTRVVNGELGRKCGTPEYVAPEVFTGKYNEKCDMWSVGVILYIMLLGEMPFKGKTVQDTVKLVTDGNLPCTSKNWGNISDDAKDLILKLLVKDPKQRHSADEALRHAWICKFTQPIQPKDLADTLNKLKTFHVRNNLGLAALNFINNCLSSEQDRRVFHRQFDFLDKNRNGVLSFDEMVEGYASIYGQAVAQKVVQDVFDKLDINQNGSLEYNEFITYALMNDKEIQQNKLKEAFKMFDLNKDGLISCEETKNILKSNLSELDDQELNEVIKQIDENRDGFIDEHEFIKCLKTVSCFYDNEGVKRSESLKTKTEGGLSEAMTNDKILNPVIEADNESEQVPEVKSAAEKSIHQPEKSHEEPRSMEAQKTHNEAYREDKMEGENSVQKDINAASPPLLKSKRGRPKNSERQPYVPEPTTRQTRQQSKKETN